MTHQLFRHDRYTLRKKFFKVRHMAEGVIEWRARGFRIETQHDESRT